MANLNLLPYNWILEGNVMIKENLLMFLSTKPNRWHLEKPWSRDGFTYATNGHIIVRVSALADIPDDDQSPNAKEIFDKAPIPTAWLPIPNDLPERDIKICDSCGGVGKLWIKENKQWEE